MTMHQLFPFAGSVFQDPRTLSRQVWDAGSARSIPGVGRALDLYTGQIASCAMEAVRGDETLPRPRILEKPDPDESRHWFVRCHVEDYLLHGNALHLITTRDRLTGWPSSVRWFPSWRWSITEERNQPVYWLDGSKVNRDDVVHVKRGADPAFPYRGIGVVEQYLGTLDRAGLQEAAESANLRNRGTPSVAVIAPNPELGQTEVDNVADRWVERYSGPDPRPGIFPSGTQIVPLSWNPNDAQMVQARNLTLKDLANAFNLDGYWLGAEGSSHTYRSPGAMYLTLLKTSLAPVMDMFVDVWSFAWLVRGQSLRFDTSELLRDDLLTMVQAFAQGSAFFPDPNEPRRYMGFPALPADAFPPQPPMVPPPASPSDPSTPPGSVPGQAPAVGSTVDGGPTA